MTSKRFTIQARRGGRHVRTAQHSVMNTIINHTHLRNTGRRWGRSRGRNSRHLRTRDSRRTGHRSRTSPRWPGTVTRRCSTWRCTTSRRGRGRHTTLHTRHTGASRLQLKLQVVELACWLHVQLTSQCECTQHHKGAPLRYESTWCYAHRFGIDDWYLFFHTHSV